MARTESDRDDLFAEARALVRRWEIRIAEVEETIVAGFRTDGVLVLYFGADPMFQFDDRGRLRRAFIDGHLLRGQGVTLAVLQRSRSPTETTLVRSDCTPEMLTALRQRILERIGQLVHDLQTKPFTVTRKHPAEEDLPIGLLTERLRRFIETADWIAPALPGKS